MKSFIIIAAVLIATGTATAPASAARLKDLVDVQGSRTNALVGLGIVVGLAGTGDDASSFMARRPLATIMKNLGAAADPSEITARNVAMVLVTAELPPFGRAGTEIEVTVSSIGTARSLRGGTLIATALKGLDRQIYAIAQGQVVVSGYDVRAQSGSSQQKNPASAGRVPGGGVIERDAPSVLPVGDLVLLLKTPDFTTAARIKSAIEAEIGAGTARVLDPSSVVVTASTAPGAMAALIARIEGLEATPDVVARVVIDERSGTVVVGGGVRLGAAAVSYGTLTIKIRERTQISQPGPFGRGNTQTAPSSEIEVEEKGAQLATVGPAATVGEVAAALNALGVKARDLMPIFEALKAAGALTAEIRAL